MQQMELDEALREIKADIMAKSRSAIDQKAWVTQVGLSALFSSHPISYLCVSMPFRRSTRSPQHIRKKLTKFVKISNN